MKFCSKCTSDMSTCWGIQSCQKMSVWMKWPLARVQVSTCTFCKFVLTALLGVISRSQICFSFMNGVFQSVQNPNFATFRLWNVKMTWFLTFMHPFHKRKSYVWCRRQMQAVHVIKMSKTSSGHLHACKCPERKYALLTWPDWISLFLQSPYVIFHPHASLFMSEMPDFVKNVFFCVFPSDFQFWCPFPSKVMTKPKSKGTQQMMYRLWALFGINLGQFWAVATCTRASVQKLKIWLFAETDLCRF